MKINLHIERLVLDGLPVSRLQGSAVRAAVEQELARLLMTGGVLQEVRAGGAAPALRAPPIRLEKASQPGAIGKQIAGVLYARMGSRSSGPHQFKQQNRRLSGKITSGKQNS